MPCWLDQTFSIKYLIFYYRELSLEIKLQGTVFDADYKNANSEKILQPHAAEMVSKILNFNRHLIKSSRRQATEGWTHPQRVTDKCLANSSPDRSCRLHVRDNAEGK